MASEPPAAQLATLVQLFNAGRLDPALNHVDRLLGTHPASATLYYIRGRAQAGLDRPAEAIDSFRRVLQLQPDHADACFELGSALLVLGEQGAAEASFARALEIDPKHADALQAVGQLRFAAGDAEGAAAAFRRLAAVLPESADLRFNLALALHAAGAQTEAMTAYEKALELDPELADAHNNLGLLRRARGDLQAAAASFRRAIALRPDFAEAHHNLGITLRDTGKLDAALTQLEAALALRPDHAESANQLGNVHVERGALPEARQCYEQALAIDPHCADAHWNLFGTAADPVEASAHLERCLAADAGHLRARLTLAALQAHAGERQAFEALNSGPHRDHPFVRSFRWVQDLPRLPVLLFDRWSVFDWVIARSDRDRPFYEFGVWRGASFRHLIAAFGCGFGFDTFAGLPEDWHDTRRGSYSSDGEVPTVEGGTFIAGRFEDTLPHFFATARPLASVVNLDADLYSATRCALDHAQAVMDARTLLVFDEFLMNDDWEQDEYRALEDFCRARGCGYEVLALSYFTKQVVVRLVA
jgi:tetratricopeptide (TPR) repeat protein